jgi:hypothetical protein
MSAVLCHTSLIDVTAYKCGGGGAGALGYPALSPDLHVVVGSMFAQQRS